MTILVLSLDPHGESEKFGAKGLDFLSYCYVWGTPSDINCIYVHFVNHVVDRVSELFTITTTMILSYINNFSYLRAGVKG